MSRRRILRIDGTHVQVVGLGLAPRIYIFATTSISTQKSVGRRALNLTGWRFRRRQWISVVDHTQYLSKFPHPQNPTVQQVSTKTGSMTDHNQWIWWPTCESATPGRLESDHEVLPVIDSCRMNSCALCKQQYNVSVESPGRPHCILTRVLLLVIGWALSSNSTETTVLSDITQAVDRVTFTVKPIISASVASCMALYKFDYYYYYYYYYNSNWQWLHKLIIALIKMVQPISQFSMLI